MLSAKTKHRSRKNLHLKKIRTEEDQNICKKRAQHLKILLFKKNKKNKIWTFCNRQKNERKKLTGYPGVQESYQEIQDFPGIMPEFQESRIPVKKYKIFQEVKRWVHSINRTSQALEAIWDSWDRRIWFPRADMSIGCRDTNICLFKCCSTGISSIKDGKFRVHRVRIFHGCRKVIRMLLPKTESCGVGISRDGKNFFYKSWSALSLESEREFQLYAEH